MKLHQQFDLNTRIRPDLAKSAGEVATLVERLVKSLVDKGYMVIKSSASHMGVPQNITVIKDITGSVTQFTIETEKDFQKASRTLGIEKLFS